MKSFLNSHKKKLIIAALVLLAAAALLVHLIHPDFPCLNSDEAAFGYNAYSILKTGADEYGHVLPTRLLSFGENKLPLMAYLSIPFIGLMGLTQQSVRMIPLIIGVITPFLFFILARELFKRIDVALLAAFLSSVSPAIQILSRHAHEDVVAYFFLILTILFFIRFRKYNRLIDLTTASLFNGLALFSQHIAKPFSILFLAFLLFDWFKNRKKQSISKIISYLIIFLVPIIFFAVTELSHPTNRIQNLVFWQDPGFTLQINELRGQHNIPLLYNKVTYGLYTVGSHYLSYFTPHFLVFNGDSNIRFGYSGISPISLIEYVFFFIGIYFVVKRRYSSGIFLLFILLVSPLTAALSWQTQSLTRAFFMFVPTLLFTAYGFVEFISMPRVKSWRPFIAFIFFGVLIFSLYNSWRIYFTTYRLDPETGKAWECGYQELGNYIKNHYSDFDRFYITKKNGQPYIYTLFYLAFPPKKYQPQARLSPPDEYGFGQIESFDKFYFNFVKPDTHIRAAYIGFPEEFEEKEMRFDPQKMISLKSNGNEVYWVFYESRK